MHWNKNMNFNHHQLDMIQASGALIAYLGFSITEANEVLKFITGIATFSYLVYKWRKDVKGK